MPAAFKTRTVTCGTIRRVGAAVQKPVNVVMSSADPDTWVRDTYPGKDLKAIFRQAPKE